MSAFPSDIVPDEVEEHSLLNDAISAVLLVISVVVWMCFWGTVWFSSLIYVALHGGDEHAAHARDAAAAKLRRA
jgi:hypothetical protein